MGFIRGGINGHGLVQSRIGVVILIFFLGAWAGIACAAENHRVGSIDSFVELLEKCADTDEMMGVTKSSGEMAVGTIRRITVRKPARETEIEFNTAGETADRGPRFRLKELKRVGIREYCYHIGDDAVVAVTATKVGKEWIPTKPERQTFNPLRSLRTPSILYVSGQVGHIFYSRSSIGEVNGRSVNVLHVRAGPRARI